MRVRILALVALLTSAFAVPAAAQSLRVGVVDMETAMFEVEDGRRARTTLQAKQDEYVAERERRQTEINRKQEELDAQTVMLAPDALRAREEELYRLAMEGQMYVYETEQEIMALNQQLFGDILEKMARVCKALAQEEGFDMILDAAVVYSFKPDMDLTQKVITRYDATK